MNIYPNLPGLTYSTFKTPQFKTRTQKSVSGRELRMTFQPVVTWQFKVKYNFLRDAFDQRLSYAYSGSPSLTELRTLMGFFLQQQGSLTPFWFDDPTDDSVVGQNIGTGDGTTTQFQLTRTLGGSGFEYTEPVLAPNIVYNVYVAGVAQQPNLNYVVNQNNGIITFTSAPPMGNAITADFSFYFLCRFLEDSQEFENFMAGLWNAEVKLQSILI